MVYTIRNGQTWLLADVNDDGLLDGRDFAVRFSGRHEFTEADFVSADFVIAGTDGNDEINGTANDDVMFGLAGNDLMRGRGGNELNGGAGRDTLEGGSGFNTLSGDAGADVLTLANSDNGGTASGGAGNDLLIGSNTSETQLDGGLGNDTLIAGDGGGSLTDFEGGDDRLEGGIGDDQFFGGIGVDQFVFGPQWTSDGFQDRIFDLEDGVERIDLSGSGLEFADLTIDNSGFSAVITSAAGQIEVDGFGEQGPSGPLSQDDFLF